MTDFASNVYDSFLVDLATGQLSSGTTMNALILSNSYNYDPTHTNVAAVSANEISGGSYARFTGSAVFTITQVNDSMQYTALTPTVTFVAFTGTWRYIILFNNTAPNKLYMCFDAGVPITQTTTAVTLSSGTDPFITLSAP